MRAASFLRMPNCNAFAGSFPCPISWAWKLGSIFDSYIARLSNLGHKIWSLNAVKWNMTPVFDSWPGRGYDLGGQIRVSTWSRIWFGGSFYPSDHPEHQIWGSVLPFRPPRASNLGVIFAFPAARKSNLGGQIRSATSRKGNLGVILASSTCPTP